MIDLLIYVILPVVLLGLEFLGLNNYYCLNPDGTFRKIRLARIWAYLLIILGFIPLANICVFTAMVCTYPFSVMDKENKISLFKDITGMTPKEVFGPKPTWGDRLFKHLTGNFFGKEKKS